MNHLYRGVDISKDKDFTKQWGQLIEIVSSDCYASVLKSKNHRLFTKIKKQSLFGLAKAEFNLKNFRFISESKKEIRRFFLYI